VTKIGSFTVSTSDSTVAVEVPSDWTTISQSGTATVNIVGYETILANETGETISSTPADLTAKGYVWYNHGGYTVLHALIDALKTNAADFTCKKGVLAPAVTISGTVGSGAGWICEVNGKVVTDYANTLVNGGDSIVFYYNQATSSTMRHAWFMSKTVSAAKDGSASLTLVSTPVNNDGSAATAVSGAIVYIDGVSWGTTDSNGSVTLSGLTNLAVGAHTVTAQKNDSSGKKYTDICPRRAHDYKNLGYQHG
jgi:hypothetical protein